MAADIVVTLKDGNNNDISVRAHQFDDGKIAFYHALDDRLPLATSRGGTITTANTSQSIAIANPNRKFFVFQNTSDTTMYVSDNGANASLTNGYKVLASGFLNIYSNSEIKVFCTVATKTFMATEGNTLEGDAVVVVSETIMQALEDIRDETINAASIVLADLGPTIAQEFSESLLDVIDNTTGMPTIIVHPTVVGSAGTGTLASPRSLEYTLAGAGGTITEPTLILLRGERALGTAMPSYKPYSVAGIMARNVGFEATSALPPGTIIANYPGEVPLISDPLNLGPWTQIDAVLDIWESTGVVDGTTHFVVGYYNQNGDHIMIGALRGPTGGGPYTTNVAYQNSMMATSSYYREDGKYYPGPCIVRLGSTTNGVATTAGKVRICLKPNYPAEDVFFGSTTRVYPASTNPNLVDLHIYRMDDGAMTITGSNITVRGLKFRGFARGVPTDSGDNNVIEYCDIAGPGIGIQLSKVGGHTAGVYRYNTIDMMQDYDKWPGAWGDVKMGIEILTNSRTHAFSPQNSSVSGYAYGNKIKRAYDATVFLSPFWHWGFKPLPGTYANMDEFISLKESNANIFEDIWDDAIQMTARSRGTVWDTNLFLGAPVSRDGASSVEDFGPDLIRLQFNIFASNKQILWARRGRDYENLKSGVASGKLAAPIGAADTTVTLEAGKGALFPAIPGSPGYLERSIAAPSGGTSTFEGIRITAIVGDTLTIVRGQRATAAASTVAKAWGTNASIINRLFDVRPTDEGFAHQAVMKTHGEPNGAAYRFPWEMVWNTFDQKLTLGIGFLNNNVLQWGNEATLVQTGNPKNLFRNNLYMDAGGRSLISNPADPNFQCSRYLATSRIYSARGDNDIDGNAFVAIDTPTDGASGTFLLIQLLRDSTGFDYNNNINTNAEFFQGQLLTDAQNFAGLTLGWQGRGSYIFATRESQITDEYKPHAGTIQASGAIPLPVGTSLPNMPYTPTWRGAKRPV